MLLKEVKRECTFIYAFSLHGRPFLLPPPFLCRAILSSHSEIQLKHQHFCEGFPDYHKFAALPNVWVREVLFSYSFYLYNIFWKSDRKKFRAISTDGEYPKWGRILSKYFLLLPNPCDLPLQLFIVPRLWLPTLVSSSCEFPLPSVVG